MKRFLVPSGVGHFTRAGQAKLGPPMLERFDENARTVFARARDEARALGRECIDTEHVLLGVCHQDAKDSDPVLAPAGITTQSVKAWLAQHGGQPGGTPDGSLPFTPNVWIVLYQTHVEASGRQHQSIGPAHVLLALIRCAIVAPKAVAPTTGAAQPPQEDASGTGPPETGRQPVQTSPADPDVVAALLRDCEIDPRAPRSRRRDVRRPCAGMPGNPRRCGRRDQAD